MASKRRARRRKQVLLVHRGRLNRLGRRKLRRWFEAERARPPMVVPSLPPLVVLPVQDRMLLALSHGGQVDLSPLFRRDPPEVPLLLVDRGWTSGRSRR